MAAEPIKLTAEEQAGVKLSPSGAPTHVGTAPDSDIAIANASIAGGSRILKREGNVITIDLGGQKKAAEELAAARQQGLAEEMSDDDFNPDRVAPTKANKLPTGSKPISEREGTLPAAPGAPAPGVQNENYSPSDTAAGQGEKQEEAKPGEQKGQPGAGAADASQEPQKNTGEQKTATPPLKGWQQAANQAFSPIMRMKNWRKINEFKKIAKQKKKKLRQLELRLEILLWKQRFAILRIIIEVATTIGIIAAVAEVAKFIKDNVKLHNTKSDVKRLKKDLEKIDKQIFKLTQFFNADKVNRRKEQELNARVAQQQKQPTQQAA